MKVVFLNRFYWPEEPATAQLLTDLAEGLAAGGTEVTVITSRELAGGTPPREVRRGVQILRALGSRCTGRIPGGKALDFAMFWLTGTWRLLWVVRPGDIVVAMTDPPLAGLGASLVACLRRARLVHWVQDIYPELAMELAGQTWLRFLRPWRNLSWRRADRCVTLGTEMGAVLQSAGVPPGRIEIIPNWAPASLAPPSASDVTARRSSWGLEGKFVVAYSGNLGRVHDLTPVLALADALRAATDIVFLFIGGGPLRDQIEAEALHRGLQNVHFRPAQPRQQLAVSLSVADAHLVTLKPGCEHFVFPSKFYGILAVRRPMIFIGPRTSELARTIAARGLGLVAERDEIGALAAGIQQLVGEPARRTQIDAALARFAREAGSVDSARARWRKLLAELHPCRPSDAADKTLPA